MVVHVTSSRYWARVSSPAMHGNTKQHLSLCMARCVCSASTPRPDDRSSIETFFRGQSCPRCVSVEAAATKWDVEGRPARRRSTRLYHLRTMLSFFPSPVFASSARTKATRETRVGHKTARHKALGAESWTATHNVFSAHRRSQAAPPRAQTKSRAAALTARPTRPSTRSLLCPTMQSASLSLLCEA